MLLEIQYENSMRYRFTCHAQMYVSAQYLMTLKNPSNRTLSAQLPSI